MFGRYLRPALEAADGRAVNEIEHVIYARIVDMDQLKKAASIEHQEQWEIKIPKTDGNAGSGSIRVRKTWVEGSDPTYEIVTKVKKNADGDKIEVSLPGNENVFLQFKFLSESGMIKDRHRFPVEGTDLVWEVDMFKKADGTYHNWCKIDLEVPSRNDQLPELPMQFATIIMPEGMGEDDKIDREKTITNLYRECFLTTNTFLSRNEDSNAV